MKGIIAEQVLPVDEDIFTQPLPGTTSVYPVLDDDMTQYVDDMTHYIQDTEVEDLQGFNGLNCVKEPVKNRRNKRKVNVKHNIRDNSELNDDLTQYTLDTNVNDLTQEFNSQNSIQTPIKRARNKIKAVKRNMRKTYSIDDDLTQYTQDVDIEVDVQEIDGLGSVNYSNTRARKKRNTSVKRNVRQKKVKKKVSENHSSDLDVTDISDDYDDDGHKVTECNNSRNAGVSPQDTISGLSFPDNEVPNTPAVLSVYSPSILTSLEAVPGIPKSNKPDVFEKPNPGGNVIDTVKNVDKSTKTLIIENIGVQMDFIDRNIPGKGNLPFPKKDNAIEEINNRKIIPVNNLTPNIFNTQKASNNLTDISKNKVDKALNTSKVNKVKKGFDLSWIDNIKYVREIAKEEYVNVLVPENFWNNCKLPEKWNDDEFLYT